MSAPFAIDPEGCGCTDCIVRDSIPLDWMDDTGWLWWSLGRMTNRTYLSDDQLWDLALASNRARWADEQG